MTAPERQIVALPPHPMGYAFMTSDTEYFLERAITERAMGKSATHPSAVAAHEELAQRYDALVQERTRPHLRPVEADRILEAA